MTPEERLGKIEIQIQKQNEGIQGLIIVSRTVLSSVQELREAQAATEEKLNILIDIVERIIPRNDAHPG